MSGCVREREGVSGEISSASVSQRWIENSCVRGGGAGQVVNFLDSTEGCWVKIPLPFSPFPCQTAELPCSSEHNEIRLKFEQRITN